MFLLNFGCGLSDATLGTVYMCQKDHRHLVGETKALGPSRMMQYHFLNKIQVERLNQIFDVIFVFQPTSVRLAKGPAEECCLLRKSKHANYGSSLCGQVRRVGICIRKESCSSVLPLTTFRRTEPHRTAHISSTRPYSTLSRD